MSNLKLISHPSENFDERSASIDKIIIHSTECRSVEEALEILTSPVSKVSCHYLISKSGTLYQLVRDEKRAWHAGKSAWGNDEDINSTSIGIELDHPSPDDEREDYTNTQLNILIQLLKELSLKHNIKTHNILAHSDIAPDRKRDPGDDFPWEKLAEHGLGCWAPISSTRAKSEIDTQKTQKWLHEIGYRRGDFKAQITAFQRHFTRHCVNGELNAETYQRLHEIKQEIVARRKNST